MVRDALNNCFYQAHCEDTGLEGEGTQNYCYELIKRAFVESGGDYDNPTKASLKEVLSNLVEFSKNFRDQEIIKKHYSQIMLLVDKLD